MSLSPKALVLAIAAACLSVGAAGYYWVMHDDAPDAPASAASKPRAREGATASTPFGRGANTRLSMYDLPQQRDPNAIYTRSGRPLDLGGKSAMDAINSWSNAARMGDKDAAYRVYQAESVCATLNDAAPEFDSQDDRKNFESDREKVRTFCAGVSPAQVQERMHFLEIAARGGNNQARIDFYMEGPNGRTDTAAPFDFNDPQMQQWRNDAIGYLQQAGKQGDPFAYGLLSSVYAGGVLGDKNPKLSMAYAVAENIARGHALSDSQLHHRYGDSLTEAEYAEAQQMGAQLAAGH